MKIICEKLYLLKKKEKISFYHTLSSSSSSSSLCTIHVYKKLKKNEGKIIISVRTSALYICMCGGKIVIEGCAIFLFPPSLS